MQPTQNTDLVEVITPADTLRGAALYLIRHGWFQGDMFDLSDPEVAFPPACGLGGIRMAVFGRTDIDADALTPEHADAFDHAVTALADHLVLSGAVTADVSDSVAVSQIGSDAREELVADWNDDPSRIGSHVIAALKGAADEWDRFRRSLTCYGKPMQEHASSPEVWVFPGDPVQVERVFHCPTCGRQVNVVVTDPAEKALLFSQAGSGTPSQGGAE